MSTRAQNYTNLRLRFSHRSRSQTQVDKSDYYQREYHQVKLGKHRSITIDNGYQIINKYKRNNNIVQSKKMDSNQQSTIKKIDAMLQKNPNRQKEQQKKLLESLPLEFTRFLISKNIHPKQLAVQIPRYIRLKPNTQLTIAQLAESLKTDQNSIVKIDQEFYALTPHVKISGSLFYQSGQLYGIDYSSAMPVRCLDVRDGMHVLELCSAPGNKSMYIADLLKQVEITGVQINVNRANVMKSLINKYKLQDKIEVKVQDAVKFDSHIKYDRVLVDAECTHQGSIKHIKKFMSTDHSQKKPSKSQIKQRKKLTKQQQRQLQINSSNSYTSQRTKANEWSVQDFNQRFLDEKKLNNLSSLQFGLLQNGFRLLKDEGIIVYSTCSFDIQQNQHIVQKFLDLYPQAEIMDCKEGLKCAVDFQLGEIKECIKFKPSVSRCGGMFVAKIRKRPQKSKTQKIQE